LPRVAGHRAGVATVRRVVEHAPDLGIRWLTLYAFSSDNWNRPVDEVESLFWLLRAYLRMDAASAAFEVGYESASQFNREYKRFFGQPPMRDIKVRRLAGSAMDSD